MENVIRSVILYLFFGICAISYVFYETQHFYEISIPSVNLNRQFKNLHKNKSSEEVRFC